MSFFLKLVVNYPQNRQFRRRAGQKSTSSTGFSTVCMWSTACYNTNRTSQSMELKLGAAGISLTETLHQLRVLLLHDLSCPTQQRPLPIIWVGTSEHGWVPKSAYTSRGSNLLGVCRGPRRVEVDLISTSTGEGLIAEHWKGKEARGREGEMGKGSGGGRRERREGERRGWEGEEKRRESEERKEREKEERGEEREKGVNCTQSIILLLPRKPLPANSAYLNR